MKSFATEGTVFWLVVSAFLVAVSSIGEGLDLSVAASAYVVAALYLIVAYMCWRGMKWGFVAAILLALFTGVGGIFFAVLEESTSVFRAFADNAFLLVPQLILIFLSIRGYRES